MAVNRPLLKLPKVASIEHGWRGTLLRHRNPLMPPISVLLIEDDEDDYCLACDLLESVTTQDYEVEWRDNHASGLEALQSGQFDVCLIDYRLGSRTGVEVLQDSKEALRLTPAVLLTGEHSTEVDELAMLAGASDYLVKDGLTADMLERTIRYALQRRDYDARFEYLAFHDPLTDLPNRSLFIDRVSQALARRTRTGETVSVVFFDVDNFKDINDTLGHAAGDTLLTQVARRVAGVLRDHDTLARLGGDEFAVCLESPDGISVAEAFVRRAQEVLKPTFNLDVGLSVEVHASFGVAHSDLAVNDSAELLRHADIAMYDAKREGKNRLSVYEQSMHDSLLRRIQLEKDLRTSLKNDQLDVHFQPFVDLVSGDVLGVEALARWNHPILGRQSPAEFIAIAEQAGSIIDLGSYVLRESARTVQRWIHEFDYSGFVSVNVSPRQITDSAFVSTLNAILNSTGLDPERLVIEFTESVMTGDVSHVISVLEKVAELGVGIALDDFGTGYSSLSNVHQLPITIIKVDRSFVNRIDERKGRSMLATIATMAQSLEVMTIAEGIEDKGQQEALIGLGYHVGQGYLFDRAQPADVAAAFVKGRNLRSAA